MYQVSAKSRKGKGLTHKEHSQLSRSFMYLAIGTVFALEHGIEKINLFENGILAMNIPISESRIYRNTRTAHPQFLIRYNELIHTLFSDKVNIENPFYSMTKAEVVRTLDSAGFRELMKQSVSCSEVRGLIVKGVSISKTNHCGQCLPCILRRISMHGAGLWAYDANYDKDITVDYNAIPDGAKRILHETRDFGTRFCNAGTDTDILIEFPEFYVEGVEPEVAISVYRRYIDEMDDFLRSRASPTSKTSLHIL